MLLFVPDKSNEVVLTICLGVQQDGPDVPTRPVQHSASSKHPSFAVVDGPRKDCLDGPLGPPDHDRL